MRKKRAPFTAQSARRDFLFSLGKRRHEKEESSVYPSVGKKRPPFSQGIIERDPAYPLYLLTRWKRACAKEERVELSVGTKGPPVSLSLGRELLTISSSSSSSKLGRELTIKKKGWRSSKLQTLTREVWSSSRPSEGNEKPPTRSSKTSRELTPSYSW